MYRQIRFLSICAVQGCPIQISSFQRNSSSELQAFRTIQIDSVNHVESASDAQEKQARSDELKFCWKLQICKLQISSSLDLTHAHETINQQQTESIGTQLLSVPGKY